MSYQILPLTSDPNQTFQSMLSVDGNNIKLGFRVSFNEIAGYWVMQINDTKTNTILLDSIPLLPGNPPNGNLLEQFSYLGIGSAYLVNASNTPVEYPTENNLETDFQLIWGDTV